MKQNEVNIYTDISDLMKDSPLCSSPYSVAHDVNPPYFLSSFPDKIIDSNNIGIIEKIRRWFSMIINGCDHDYKPKENYDMLIPGYNPRNINIISCIKCRKTSTFITYS